MDDDLKAELQETRRMCNHRITSLKAQSILGQVIFWGAVAVAIVTWLLNIGPGVLTIIVLLAGFAITLHALLLPHPQTRRLQLRILVAFFAGLCWDVYVLRRVMDCGRLSLYSSLPELHNR